MKMTSAQKTNAYFFVLGVGLNLNALPMNPAIVAAALNQWGSAMGGLLNGMNQGNNDQVRKVH